MLTKIPSITILIIIALSLDLFSQPAGIHFNVNMSWQIETGNFDPEEDFVDIAGDFNEWGEILTPLSDTNNDSIYDVMIDDFYIGQNIQFKFRLNGVWDGNEEFSGGGPNRQYTVASATDSVYYWYNDELPGSGDPQAGFSVQVSDILSGSSLHFQNESSGIVTQWHWHFEGGTPEYSTAESPLVSYHLPGSFGVQLVAANDSLSDTLHIDDYITVSQRDTTEIDWWNHTVFYEIFVRSFYDSDGDGIGDFNGLTQKLDYLNDGDPATTDDLGITGIWLMPVNPSPSYHGYDVTNYTAINPDYGTMNDFQEFLDAAHARGIRVIVDYVMNHSSSQHPWFISAQDPQSEYRDYYRWSATNPGYPGPWGQQVWHWTGSGYYYGIFWDGMPDLNYETPEVKEEMFDVATYWLDEVGVDGFRLDAVKYIYEEGPVLEDLPQTFQFWKDFSAHTKNVSSEAYSIGEAWTNTTTVLEYVEDGGLDMCFEFDLANSTMHTAITGNATAIRNHMSMVYSIYPHLQWGTFLTNHDMNRVFSELDQNEEKNKLAAALYLTLPGVPYIYYGEEIGMLGEKPDPEIRRPMQWSPNANAGFTSGIPWHGLNSNYAEYNVEVELENPASILNRYKKMVRIRNLKPALQTGTYHELPASDESVFSFIRSTPDDTAIVVINTSAESIQNTGIDLSAAGLPAGEVSLWNMMSEDWEILGVDTAGFVVLPQMAGFRVHIWSFEMISGTGEHMPAPSGHLRLWPNPARENINIQAHAKINRVQCYDIAGHVVAEADGSSRSLQLHTGSLKPGIYIIRVRTDDGVYSERVVVK
ncbi:MAG: alpha-amylase family glycosyl hydrolase [Bacteroidales bacterium]